MLATPTLESRMTVPQDKGLPDLADLFNASWLWDAYKSHVGIDDIEADRLRIKHRLLDRGMSLVELARLSGLPYDRLVRVVNGYRPPRQHEIKSIAAALGLPEPAIEEAGPDPTKEADQAREHRE